MNKLLNFFLKISNNSYITAIRTAFLKIIPFIIIQSFSSLIINFFDYFAISEKVIVFYTGFLKISIVLRSLIPYLFIFLFVQYIFQIKHKKYELQLSYYSVISLSLYSVFFNKTFFSDSDSLLLRALILGLLNYKLFIFEKKIIYFLYEKTGKKFMEINSLFEQFITGFIHLTILSIIYYFLSQYFLNLKLDLSLGIQFDNSLKNPLIYNMIILVPWIFGMNGSHFVQNSFSLLFNNSVHNIQALVDNSSNFYYVDSSFYNLYIFMGGSGATLCLVFAMLMSKNKNYIGLGKFALIPSLFNINEIIIYGLPIIGNPFLIIPFLLVPTIFTILSYFALYLGILNPASTYTSWLNPIIISGWIADKGGISIILWQIFLLILGTSIYMFFLKQYEKFNSIQIESNINFLSDTSIKSDISSFSFNYIIKTYEAKEKLNTLMNNGHFILYFQPIVDIKTNKVSKLECLLRLSHKNLGIVGPYFLDYFKSLNKISQVDYWVIEEAFTYGKMLEKQNDDYSLSLNISAETFTQIYFEKNIVDLAEKFQVNPKNFTIEITEEVCLDNLEIVKKKINYLQQNGFKIAIDDFGTGYSSLNYLLELSVDYIKIDRNFVINLKYEKGAKILKGIIGLCRSTGCKIIVEGVETKEELDIINEMGSDMIQGYYYFKPDSFENTLKQIKTVQI